MKYREKKKLEWHQQIRMAVILAVIFAAGAVLFSLFRTVLNPGWIEEKKELYTYEQEANVFYRVFLKPNILYQEPSLEPGNIYIAEIVDSINTFFEYHFEGEADADIQGDYEVLAVIEGYRSEEEAYESIWKREWTIVPKTNFKSNGKSLSLKREIPLDFAQYNQFAQQVIKDTKVHSDVKMTVFWNVRLDARTARGTIEENVSTSMIIPLNSGYFKIGGTLSEKKPGSIDEIKRVKAPLDKKKLIVYGILLAFLSGGLLFLLLFTKGTSFKDPLERELKNILRKYGNRLVALDNKINFSCETVYPLKSMEDLVRMADEIGKPILYQHSADIADMMKFYVLDNDRVYVLDLRNRQSQSYQVTM